MQVRKHTAALAAALLTVLSVATLAAPAVAEDEVENVALASRENAPATSVSYVTGWNSSVALNNGKSTATDNYGEMWGTWGDPADPTQDWAAYTWEQPVTVSSSRLFLWQNHLTGDSGVMLPSAWQIEYRDDAGEWMPVTGADLNYEVPVLDEADPVSSMPAVEAQFDAVTTTAVRLVLDRQDVDGELKATSVIEWEVFGTDAPVVDPEPEDPTGYLTAEAVSVRTVTGSAPELPADLWVIGENGPLTYADVVWEPVDAELYAAAGTFEVQGIVDGYESQPAFATVYVADTLSTVILSVDYSATITTPGTAPVLPLTVRANYDDGTSSSGVAVTWADIDPAAYVDADAYFDVLGVVAGYEPGALASVFVVTPATQSGPIVAIDINSAPQGAGWFTTAPIVEISADTSGTPISSIEYSFDGENWNAYSEPVTVDQQGETTVYARATDADGEVGEASETVKVDTMAPVTTVNVEKIDADSALVTLTPADPEPGSGVTRTLWSDGPDSSPTGEENNFFATYEAPFTVQLTADPRYVHVQTQDAAGNVEEYVTVLLPSQGEDALDLGVVTSARCVAGQAQLVVSVRNGEDMAVEATVATPFGEKVVQLAAGKTVSTTFAVRAGTLSAGEVEVTASADGRSFAASTPYLARTCG